MLLWLFIDLLYHPWMIDDDNGDDSECECISGMNEWQGNQCTPRKPAPLPHAALSTTDPT
jgi:hypothetical protein